MKSKWSSFSGDLSQFARGLLMGGADIIPGVSGGTVALILGIYERLVAAISHFDLTLLGHLRHRRWKVALEHCDFRFLITLACGILTGVGCLGTLMKYLLEHQLTPTLAVFFGLILASSIVVAQSVQQWNAGKVVLLALGAAFAYWLVAQPFMKGSDTYLYLFVCGAVAICAMILPGISGAFILLIMGKYKFVTDIIHDVTHGHVTLEHLLVLTIFASGCLIGLLSFSKFLRWLLAHCHGPTLAVLCGFMLGSLRRIWPFKQLPATGESLDITHSHISNALPKTVDSQVLLAIALIVVSILFVLVLDWIVRYRAKATKNIAD